MNAFVSKLPTVAATLCLPLLMAAGPEGCESDWDLVLEQGSYELYTPWVFAPKTGDFEYTLEGDLLVAGDQILGQQTYLIYEDFRDEALLCEMSETYVGVPTIVVGDASSCEGCAAGWAVTVEPEATDCADDVVSDVVGRGGWQVREEIWAASAVADVGVPSAWSSVEEELLALGMQYTLWIYDTGAAPGQFYPYYAVLADGSAVRVGDDGPRLWEQ